MDATHADGGTPPADAMTPDRGPSADGGAVADAGTDAGTDAGVVMTDCSLGGVPRNEGMTCTDCDYPGYCDRCVSGTCTVLPACGTTFVDETAARGLPTASQGTGAAWLDVDEDGDQDLFVRSVGLFINDGTGHFTEESMARGLTSLGINAYPIAVGDFDSDGDLDLFVGDDTRFGTVSNHLYENDGTGHFTDVAASAGLVLSMNTPRAAVFFDHDADGDLDLLYASEFNPPAMYRNDGSLPFGDDTSLFTPSNLQGDSASWVDYDNDGDQDLFLSTGSSGTLNHLFRNDGGTWTDIATAAGIGGPDDGSRWGGATWADVDGDGDLDMYLVHNGSAPDYLYVNQGDGTFLEEPAATAGLDGLDQVLSDAAAWADYDRDGDMDAMLGEAGLYANDGTGHFTHVAVPGLVQGSNAAWGDFDGDGLLDLYVTAFPGDADHLYHAVETGSGCAPARSIRIPRHHGP